MVTTVWTGNWQHAWCRQFNVKMCCPSWRNWPNELYGKTAATREQSGKNNNRQVSNSCEVYRDKGQSKISVMTAAVGKGKN